MYQIKFVKRYAGLLQEVQVWFHKKKIEMKNNGELSPIPYFNIYSMVG